MLRRLPDKLQLSTFRSWEERVVPAVLRGGSGDLAPDGHLAMSGDFLIITIGAATGG